MALVLSWIMLAVSGAMLPTACVDLGSSPRYNGVGKSAACRAEVSRIGQRTVIRGSRPS